MPAAPPHAPVPPPTSTRRILATLTAAAGLAALRAALPGYDVILTSHSPARRFEATRRDPGPGTWCLISSDPADLWRELAGLARPLNVAPLVVR